MAQSQARNISGLFKVEIDGVERDMKCTFSVIDALENQVFNRPIILVLNDALMGSISITNIVDVIIEGLNANGDTRFDRKEIGEQIVKNGADSYIPLFINFLTYAISGDKPLVTTKKKHKKN